MFMTSEHNECLASRLWLHVITKMWWEWWADIYKGSFCSRNRQIWRVCITEDCGESRLEQRSSSRLQASLHLFSISHDDTFLLPASFYKLNDMWSEVISFPLYKLRHVLQMLMGLIKVNSVVSLITLLTDRRWKHKSPLAFVEVTTCETIYRLSFYLFIYFCLCLGLNWKHHCQCWCPLVFRYISVLV